MNGYGDFAVRATKLKPLSKPGGSEGGEASVLLVLSVVARLVILWIGQGRDVTATPCCW